MPVCDADYPVTQGHMENGKWVQTWRCPFYIVWKDMHYRCSGKAGKSYDGCFVCDEWQSFMSFKRWLEHQECFNRPNYALDKDILKEGNRCYSPETCCLVPQYINNAFISKVKDNGLMRGVYFDKKTNKYRAEGTVKGKKTSLGRFSTQAEAHRAWMVSKVGSLADTIDTYREESFADLRVLKRLFEERAKLMKILSVEEV